MHGESLGSKWSVKIDMHWDSIISVILKKECTLTFCCLFTDMNKDICDTNEIKCKHGGRCVPAIVTGTYRCECIPGFAGNFCEIGKFRTKYTYLHDSAILKTNNCNLSTCMYIYDAHAA
jgi:hypothetical protein